MEPRERRAERSDDLFLRALELPASQRERFLATSCPDDPVIAASVFKMLAGFDRLGSFMENLAISKITTPDDLAVGTLLGDRLEVIERLGRGGMGVVYRARDRHTREIVALKMVTADLSSDPDAAGRFRDEISLARRVSHINVCRIHELFVENVGGRENFFFTMEWLDGETLAQRIARSPNLAATAILDIVTPLAAGLDAVHAAGIVHRDLKPANIFIARSDSRERIVLMDFGLAKATQTGDGSRTQEGTILGSPDYMAPEQFLGEPVSPATDVYALALIVYELARSSRAFASDGMLKTAIRRVADRAPSLEAASIGLPKNWDRVIARGLERDPARRFPNAGELVRALEMAARPARWNLSRRQWLAAGGSVAAMSAILAAVRFRSGTGIIPGSPLMLIAPLDSTLPVPVRRSVDFLLRRQLDQSVHIRVLQDDRMRAAWSRMGGNANAIPAGLRAQDYRGIALREGAPVVLFGSLSAVGDEIVLRLKIELLANSTSFAAKVFSHEFNAIHEAELVSLSSEAVAWIRKALGESSEDLGLRSRPAQELTTPDWQALQEFVRAADLWSANPQGASSEQALERLRVAIQLDPDFAVAHARLGDYLVALGKTDEGLAEQKIAAELISKRDLTDRESLRIRGMYSADTGEYAEGLRVFERWSSEYPNDSLPMFYASNAAHRLGSLEQSEHLLNEALRLEPDSYAFRMWQCLRLLDRGDLEEAEKRSKHLFKLNDDDWSDQLRSALAFARRDASSLWSILEHMRTSGSPVFQSRAYAFQACFRVEQEMHADAESILAAGLSFDRSLGLAEAAVQKTLNLAEVHLLQARASEARKECLSLLQQVKGSRLRMQTGGILARAGDLKSAQACLSAPPSSLFATPIYEHWRKRLQLEIALAKHDLQTAAAILPQIPPPEGESDWPEYKVRAFVALGWPDDLSSLVSGLLRSPGRFWFQAYRVSPGFFRAALVALNPASDPKAQLLWQFINSKEQSIWRSSPV